MSEHQEALNQSLLQACLTGDVEQAEYFISHKADINCTDAEGRTPLFHAAQIGSNVLVMTLLDAGGLPNMPDHAGVTPFMAAVNAHMYANALTIKDFGGDVNFQAGRDAPTPLIMAISCDALELAQGGKGTRRTDFLLKHGANPDLVQMCDGRAVSAVDLAARRDDELRHNHFGRLFDSYLGRDVKAEFTAASLGARGRLQVMGMLQSQSRHTGDKYRLKP